MEALSEIWHFLIPAVGGVSAIVFLFMRLSSIKKGNDQSVADEAVRRKELSDDIRGLQADVISLQDRVSGLSEKEVARVLKEKDYEHKIAYLEKRAQESFSNDNANLEMLDRIRDSIMKMSAEQTSQHMAMRELVSTEIRRLEEKTSEGRQEMFAKLDDYRREAMDIVGRK